MACSSPAAKAQKVYAKSTPTATKLQFSNDVEAGAAEAAHDNVEARARAGTEAAKDSMSTQILVNGAAAVSVQMHQWSKLTTVGAATTEMRTEGKTAATTAAAAIDVDITEATVDTPTIETAAPEATAATAIAPCSRAPAAACRLPVAGEEASAQIVCSKAIGRMPTFGITELWPGSRPSRRCPGPPQCVKCANDVARGKVPAATHDRRLQCQSCRATGKSMNNLATRCKC